MRAWWCTMEQWYKRIISGEAAGLVPALVRYVLAAVALFYGLSVRLRNMAYDAGWKKVIKLPVPVISVGNLTTGGTGKTPTVIMIVQDLIKLGRRPAVLTRGYKAPQNGVSDEVLVIQEECPGVPVLINRDRVAGGRQAIEKFGADVLILDDGYQHRRLARDLNLLLVDATSPMGIPGLLPAGSWREPPTGMRRADAIMLTRCEQVTPELADMAAGLLAEWRSPRVIFQQHTHVVGLFDAQGQRVSLIPDRVLAFAGIANPEGFVRTLESMRMNVARGCWYGDHHQYDASRDTARLNDIAQSCNVSALVTTLKDWVKLRGTESKLPIYHVRIACHVAGPEAETWKEKLVDTTK